VAAKRNARPRAVDDSVVVRAGRTYRIKVLANDRDPDGHRIRLVKVGRASTGKARKSGSKVRFRAPASFSGTLRVPYTIRDSRGARDRATLTLTVQRRSAAPARAVTPTRWGVERALANLGMPVGYVDGYYDARTRRAVCAWRTVTGRPVHRGLPTSSEARAIVATRGLPSAGSRLVNGVTVSVTCQAAFWVGGNRAIRRIMAASTGKPGYRTRLGTHRIFVSFPGWSTSTIYPEARMYKLMQFSGGQGLHGSATDALVFPYPASHGCVRMFHRDIDAMRAGGVGNGTLVRVIGSW
jgi:hypothetical protein